MSRFCIFIFTAFLTSFASAQDQAAAPMKGENFQEMKNEVLSRLDARMKSLTSEKSCVSSAKNHDDMKKCREMAMANRKEMKADRMEFREGKKAKREEMKAKREEWKSKRKEWKNERGGNNPPPPPPGTEDEGEE